MEKAKQQYAVNQLAKLAGVSVRTLHVYDRMGLFKPSVRTATNYRLYGETELLRLQQILFYKELDFPLKSIGQMLNDPHFNLIKALDSHKAAIKTRRKRLDTLITTINKTIDHLKHKTMQNFEELYEGMPREQALAYRKEAVEKWGEESVARSERALLELPKLDIEHLKAEQKDITKELNGLVNENPQSDAVQLQIARHYANIRSFWGVADPTDLTAAQYKGLADLYLTDDRYTTTDGQTNPKFAKFMREAMVFFADKKLK